MKFMVDAQLPRSLAKRLNELGHKTQHTWDLEMGNRTPDRTIARIADKLQAVVITKDTDFLDSHMLQSSPARLLLVSTGNLPNRELIKIFEQNITAIVSALGESALVELNHCGLVIH